MQNSVKFMQNPYRNSACSAPFIVLCVHDHVVSLNSQWNVCHSLTCHTRHDNEVTLHNRMVKVADSPIQLNDHQSNTSNAQKDIPVEKQ